MNSGNQNNDQNNFEEISLKDLIIKIKAGFHYLFSKWIIILLFGIVGGLLGFMYAYLKKPLYVATTTFVLEDSGSNGVSLGNLGGITSMLGLDVESNSGIFQGDNILELYKSRTMIEKTLLTQVELEGENKLLISSYIDFNNLREKWINEPELKDLQFNTSIKFSRLQDSVLGSIVNDISKNYLSVVKPDKKLSIIRAEVKAQNEFFAKAFNEQIVKNVNDFYVQTKTKKSLENVAILQQKTDSVRVVMNGSIYNAAAVIDATPNLNPTRQIQRAAPVQRSQFSAETNRAILGELVKNLELSKISLRKETPLIQVIDHPIFPLQVNYLNPLLFGLMFFIITILIMMILLPIIKRIKKINAS